jgi:multidrug efflux pump subunit AcrB
LRNKQLVQGNACRLHSVDFGAMLMQQQFFPSSDRPELHVELRLSQSASIYQTRAVAERFEKVLAEDPT